MPSDPRPNMILSQPNDDVGSRPKLRPRACDDGSAWYVDITWPDGRSEQIGDFGLEATANDWIAWEAASYLRAKRFN